MVTGPCLRRPIAPLLVILGVAAAVSGGACCHDALAAELAGAPAPAGPKGRGLPFLDTTLNELLRAPAATAVVTQASAVRWVKVSLVFRDEASAAAAVGALPAMGAEVTAHYRRLVDAQVPTTRLRDLGNLSGLMIAHRPLHPAAGGRAVAREAAASGAVITEGVAAAGADAWHTGGIDGQGTTVGIIDEFEQYSDALAVGETPAALESGVLDETGLQGTAAAEIVYDTAPGAALLLASATTTTEAASAIAALAAAGAQVISSSRQYLTPDAFPYSGPGREPGDGSGDLCQAITDARAVAGTIFVQAAGDLARSHWDGTFLDSDRNFYHEFAPGLEMNEIQLGTESVSVFLRWDEWPATDQDFDLELWVESSPGTWQLADDSHNEQSGSQPPWEYIDAVLDPAKQYALRIKKYGATRNVFLDLTEFGGAELELTVPQRSLGDVAACPDAFVVAAVDAQDPSYQPEPSSSQGPSYGPGGTEAGGWDQPRISAYANVDTWSLGENGFGGTPAATPHVAGALALVRQQHPSLTSDQVLAFLEARAIDLAGAGYDHATGAGRLFLGAPGACTYELSQTGAEVADVGGDGSFDVTAPSGCPWAAATSDAWITITGGVEGPGNGTVAYSVEVNNGLARAGAIVAAGLTFTVSQAAAPCIYGLSAPSVAIGAAGGDASVDVTTNLETCEWTAVANDAWITITGGAAGTGAGTVQLDVAANEGEARSGTVTIGDQTFTVEQEAVACAIQLSAPGVSVGAEGGDGSVDVTTNLASCEWAAVSNDEWITVTGGASGTGAGTVLFAAAANDGEARSGSLTIGGATFSIDQAAVPCTYELSAPGVAVGAAGGDGSVDVTANLASCEWTAAANDAWITVTGGASGSGAGAVTFTVAANDGEARAGTLTVAGLTFTVNQAAAPCSYQLSEAAIAMPSAGGAASVDVTANLGSCAWTAVASVGWITVTGGASGAGAGTVSFTVAANLGEARNGTIAIAGQTFTVDQEAVPCAYSLSAASKAFSATGGSGSVAVTANLASCGWTAVASDAWITVTGGATGTGNGNVTYSVAANGGDARTGTITIAGKTYTVLQNAAGCAYSLYSWSSTWPAGGGEGQTRVYTTPSCTWNAISNAAWITITGGSSGTGDTFVDYVVDPNPGPSRVGTLTVAGYTYTVTQEGAPCSFSLSASEVHLGAAGGSGSVDVTASNEGCQWGALSTAPDWLLVTAGTTGQGNGAVSFTVAENLGDVRTGTLIIGGQVFTVNQSSPPCVFTLDPISASWQAAGGSDTITVACNFASCAWEAVSDSPAWLTVSGGAAGVGPGAVSYTVADNPGEPRAGMLTIGGQSFAVSQDKHGVKVKRNVKRKPPGS